MLIGIIKWGFGHHAAFLNKEERYHSLLYFFIFQCLVKNTVGLTKVSFLLLYLDIFPQKKFRLICWSILIQIAIILTAMSFITIFQCNPIALNFDKTVHGKWLVVIFEPLNCYKGTNNCLQVLTSKHFGMLNQDGTPSWML